MVPQNMARLASLGLRGLTLASKLVLVLFLARFLSPAEVGLYGLMAATVGYSIFLVGLDFYIYTTRELFRYEKRQWGALLKSQAALGGCLYFIFIPAILIIFSLGLLPIHFAPWFVLLLIVEHLGQELNRVLVAISEQVTASLVLFLRFGLWSLVLIVLMHYESSARHLNTVFGFWLIGGALACALGLWTLFRVGIDGWKDPIDWVWIRRGILVAVPFLIATLALRALFTIDRYWVEATGGLELLGAYVLFIGLAAAMLSFLDAGVFAFLYPRLIAAVRADDGKEFIRGMRSLLNQTLVLAASFIVVALLVIVPLLGWIGRPLYLTHVSMFPWILLGVLINALSMIPHFGLYAQGLDRSIIRSHLAGLGAFLPATLIASRWGPELAVPLGLCVAFSVILIWKSLAYSQLTPRHLRFANASTDIGFE